MKRYEKYKKVVKEGRRKIIKSINIIEISIKSKIQKKNRKKKKKLSKRDKNKKKKKINCRKQIIKTGDNPRRKIKDTCKMQKHKKNDNIIKVKRVQYNLKQILKEQRKKHNTNHESMENIYSFN